MILVDTSVWIDHLRSADSTLIRHLSSGKLVMHSMVMGELACGNLRDRAATMNLLDAIPKIGELTNGDVITRIEQEALAGRGIGFVDAHLLCAVKARQGACLWTRDRGLKGIAEEFGVAYVETASGAAAGEAGDGA
ncbi:MAG: type II toxin-antitoxin system VapC family toxin [Gammaproteobacteria bacterium]|nr:type II toxin-antitoxin system VapC family toxin [Gammaproteobacteria bacterium]MXW46374.1 type II toxin-antitoxin system VapC family toxin [Gammaproteobacteria bacterium]MYD01241.1 type II toxin-antitoxin system VapC family toxin [Gammaproteobacteria bacterium]MYI26373.1 type II toxin-antitoxin system VapC family toxin [Gammaproteobacteria bacterium]